jgi:hypothetical protein
VKLLNSMPLKTSITFPRLLSHPLIVYRLHATHRGDCQSKTVSPTPKLETGSNPIIAHVAPTFTPLVQHTVTSIESHFHPLFPPHSPQMRPILLHSHNGGPFISTGTPYGVNLTVYQDGTCVIDALSLHGDLWASLGRVGLRYWGSILACGVGIVTLMLAESSGRWTRDHAERELP